MTCSKILNAGVDILRNVSQIPITKVLTQNTIPLYWAMLSYADTSIKVIVLPLPSILDLTEHFEYALIQK